MIARNSTAKPMMTALGRNESGMLFPMAIAMRYKKKVTTKQPTTKTIGLSKNGKCNSKLKLK